MTSDEIFNIAHAIAAAEEDVSRRHPSVQQVLRWFAWNHLPQGPMRDTSRLCAALAGEMIVMIPADDPELTAGLRKLLEAKDCLVRAAIAAQSGAQQ